jgi:hypothetical protein
MNFSNNLGYRYRNVIYYTDKLINILKGIE